MVRKRSVLTARSAMLVLLTACGGPHAIAPTRTPSSLVVSCDRTELATGQQAHCQARMTFSDSTVQDQTASAQWSSSDSSRLSAATGGVVTAVARGTADVIATVQGLSGRQTIAVDEPCLFSLSAAALAFPSTGGSQIVTVTAIPTPCGPSTWTASATDAGLTIVPAVGDGSGSVTVTAAPNSGAAETLLATIAGRPLTVSVAAPPPAAAYRTLALTLVQGEVLSGPYAGTATTAGGFSCTLQFAARVECPILTVPDGTTVVITVALAPQLAGLGHPIRPTNTTGCDVVSNFTTCQVLMTRDRNVTIGIGWDVSPAPVPVISDLVYPPARH